MPCMYVATRSSLLLITLCAGLAATEVRDAATNQLHSGTCAEPRGCYAIDPALLGGTGVRLLVTANAGDPTTQVYLSNEAGCAVVIGCTKIRPDYPQDDGLLRKKVTPLIPQYERFGKEAYTGEELREHDRLVVRETNTAFEFKGPDDFLFVIQSNGFAPQPNSVRVDRHLVKNGFYCQVVAIIPLATGAEAARRAEALNVAVTADLVADGQ